MKMEDAARVGDIFVTVTGGKHALDAHHFQVMKDEAVIANSGHFNIEINIDALEDAASEKKSVRPMVDQYVMSDGRRINLLAEGRLVNLAAAEGHPPSVMDMSFANQALSIAYLAGLEKPLANDVYTVPEEIDQRVARLKLESLKIQIDTLTSTQKLYLESWEEGT